VVESVRVVALENEEISGHHCQQHLVAYSFDPSFGDDFVIDEVRDQVPVGFVFVQIELRLQKGNRVGELNVIYNVSVGKVEDSNLNVVADALVHFLDAGETQRFLAELPKSSHR